MKLTATVKYAMREQLPDGMFASGTRWYRVVGTEPFTDDDYLLADNIKDADDAPDLLHNIRRFRTAAVEGAR